MKTAVRIIFTLALVALIGWQVSVISPVFGNPVTSPVTSPVSSPTVTPTPATSPVSSPTVTPTPVTNPITSPVTLKTLSGVVKGWQDFEKPKKLIKRFLPLKNTVVTVKNVKTGETQEFITNEDGQYSFTLPVGKYVVCVTDPDFWFINSEKTVQVKSDRTINFRGFPQN